MKFVHIADMHFDSSLSSLSEIEGLTEKIRLKPWDPMGTLA